MTHSRLVFESGVSSDRPLEEHLDGALDLSPAFDTEVLPSALQIPSDILFELSRRGGILNIWFEHFGD